MLRSNPVCAVPSCASTPTTGFGSLGLKGYRNPSYGDLGYGGFGYGGGALVESASNLGILDGVRPPPINRNSLSNVLIQPLPVFVTRPGPFFATPELFSLGGNVPRVAGCYGLSGGFGYGNQGLGFRELTDGYLGSRYFN